MQAQLKRNTVSRITWNARHDADDAGDIIGSWTGEIDTWGKFTIAPLDRRQPTLYLFLDEIVDVDPLSPAEIEEEKRHILRYRMHRATELMRQAAELLTA